MRPAHRLCTITLVFGVGACAADSKPGAERDFTVEPTTAPLSGRTPLEVVLPPEVDVDAVVAVYVESELSLRGLELRTDGERLRFVDQGSPRPGPAELVVVSADGTETRLPDAFTYTPAADPVFERIAALGASLTQGVQGGVPTAHGLLHSPGAFVASRSGGFLPLPLLVPDLFPTIGPADIGPAPECEVPGVSAFVGDAALEVVGQLSTGDGLDLSLGRQDPMLPAWHVAVGGAQVGDLEEGPASDDFAGQFLARLVYAPDVALGAPLPHSQLDLIDAAAPSLVLCTDLAGNDVILPVTRPGPIDLSALTPADAVAASVERVVARLAETGAEVFLATLPRPTLLPLAIDKRRRLVAEGYDAGEVDAVFETVDARAEANNAAMVAAADRYDNVHIVDLAGAVERVEAEGVAVGDQTLGPGKLGGLISTDGVHFSDTGYAMTANVFIERINDALGTDVPQVDLAAIAAADPYHPDALRAAGLDPTACD